MKAGAVAIIDQYFKQRTGTSVKKSIEPHQCAQELHFAQEPPFAQEPHFRHPPNNRLYYSWVLPVLLGSKCFLLKETTH